MKKTITVFGSSKPVETDEQYKFAYELGSLLAQKGFNVCTGGFFGIMEALSKGAVENGGEAIGVTVKIWGPDANKYLTKEIKCNSLFVILQGGTGTLLELATVWELSNKGLMNNKPIACHSSMWRGIISIMNIQMEYEGRNTHLVKSFQTTETIIDYLTNQLV